MRPKRKYYKIRSEAIKAAREFNELHNTKLVGVFKMCKGSRKAGWYVVCDFIEYLNTY